MSQRAKARKMMTDSGHGAELKHISMNVAPPGPCMAGAPNCAADNTGAMGGTPPDGPSLGPAPAPDE